MRKAEFLTPELNFTDISKPLDVLTIRLALDFMAYSAVLRAVIVIPKGFESDGESIPRWLHSLVPPFGASRRGALVHDYLYRFGGYYTGTNFTPVSRAKADRVYREFLLLAGLPKWRAWTRYLTLRAVGWIAWRDNRKRKPSYTIANVQNDFRPADRRGTIGPSGDSTS